MADAAAGRSIFLFYYEATNLIRLVQHGRADPANVRELIADATRAAKGQFPELAHGIDAGAADFEVAIERGLELKSETGQG
jgi:hypothetical protein